MTYAIEVNRLRKEYQNFQLKDVSFRLPTGTIMGFVGENGAGKTTTIKCIVDLLNTREGEVKIFGKDVREHGTKVKEDIGVVFDDIYFPDLFNAKKIGHVLDEVFSNWDNQYYVDLLKRLKVPYEKPIKQLSRGMKMKLSIASALVHRPKLLILDEPTSGLDPIIRDEILDIFMDFMQDENNSILFSTHITTDLEKIADYITFIHDGEIVFSKNKDDLLYDFGIWKGTLEEAIEIPDHAKIRMKQHAYGVEILVNRKEVNSAFPIDMPSIEDIMLFFVKGVHA